MPKRDEQKRRASPGLERKAKPRRARPEIPNKASVVSTDTLISPKGRRYTILATDQLDPYDGPKGKVKKRWRS